MFIGFVPFGVIYSKHCCAAPPNPFRPCAGDTCMAWRWKEKIPKRYLTNSAPCSGGNTASGLSMLLLSAPKDLVKRLGYCGLAGRPKE